MMKTISLLLALLVLLLGACSGSAEPTLLPAPEMEPSGAVTAVVPTPTDSPPPPGLERNPVTQLVERAVLDLAERQGVTYPTIEVLNVEPVEWPDAALGCPAEGESYAQVITPGYRITLLLGDVAFSYHSDRESALMRCDSEGPEPVSIQLENGRILLPTIDPSGLQDGIPWMPVDPVPTGEGGIADPAPIK